MPGRLATVGGRLLWDLRRQKDVVLPEGVREIGERWFQYSEVESVTIPASVAEIGRAAFCSCKNLKRAVFAPGSGLRKIGAKCFYNTGIERIEVPSDVEEIQESAFMDCGGLEEVVFEAGSRLERVGDYAFCDCKNLKNIRFPNGLETIGTNCFWNCALEAVVLPASTESIGPYAFYGCASLKSVRLNEGLEKLGEKVAIDEHDWEGGVFYGSGVESVRIPSTLKRLERRTFYGCENLKSVYIPEGVERVGEECFFESGIERIALPGTLTEIGEKAFYGCDSLTTVWVEEGCALDVEKYVGKDVEVQRRQVSIRADVAYELK